MDEATKIRRRFLVKTIRKFTIIKELRKKIRKQVWNNMKIPKIFNELAHMDLYKRYKPIIPPKQKEIRIVVEETNVGCDQLCGRKAMIFSRTFKQNLCLDCEERLTMDVGAMTFSKFKKKTK